MASISYKLRGSQKASSIYVRFRNGRKTDISTKTGFIVDHKYWSSSKGQVKPKGEEHYPDINEKLGQLSLFLKKEFNKIKNQNRSVNSQWLKNAVAKFRDPDFNDQENTSLISFVEYYRNRLKTKVNPKTGKLISSDTIRAYQTTINRLEKYQIYHQKTIELHEVDLEFHYQYQLFASDELKISINSTGADLKKIKTVCLDARDRGLKIHQQVSSRKFNVPNEKSTFVTISEDELDQLMEFSDSDYLVNAKDWLVIGCWTGCRVTDLMQLTKSNILNNSKGQQFIRYIQSKTGHQVDIPLHPHVKKILSKRKGEFPRKISDQKFNKFIKIVCKKSGMTHNVEGSRQNPISHKKEVGTFEKWELIRSHTCRRSFATNHYDKLPNKVIMSVTGHTTEKMLLDYIGETDNSHLDDFYDVWN